MKNPALIYGVLGALLAFGLSGRRKRVTKRVGSAVTVGALAAALAVFAPKFGLRLPGTAPALPPRGGA